VIENLTISGNLLTLFEGCWRFIRRYCEVWDARPRTFPGKDEGDVSLTVTRDYGGKILVQKTDSIHCLPWN